MEENKELFEIFAGTYEEYLLGFKLVKTDEDEYKLEHTVADHSHKGSLRTISSRGYLLATGGFDEIIHVYHLDENREIGTLTQHTGTVTCLTFTSDEKHLISCSEDGSIAIYRVGSWIMEKIWQKAHKSKHVNWIAVHPSNKLALSVGNDASIRTWNLITGELAYITSVEHLTKRPELVIWSDNGELYGLVHDNNVSIFTVSKGSVEVTMKTDSKVTSAVFCQDNLITLGDMNGYLYLFDVNTGQMKFKHQVNESRIKSIAKHKQHVVVATSQGLVVVYKLEKDELIELAQNNSSCRITCLTVACHCCRRERKIKKSKLKSNGDIKQELTEHVKQKINEQVNKKSNQKRKQNLQILSHKPNNKLSRVECFPKRQSWIVEEQDP